MKIILESAVDVMEKIESIQEGDVVEIKDLKLEFQKFPKNIQLTLKGNSSLIVNSISSIEAYDDSFIKVLGRSKVRLYDRAKGIFMMEKCEVFMRDRSRGWFYQDSKAYLKDRSWALFRQNSEGHLSGRAKGIFFDVSTGALTEFAEGRFYDKSQGYIFMNARAQFFNWSKCTLYYTSARVSLYGSSSLQRISEYLDKVQWIKWNHANTIKKNGKIYVYLYKWVREDFKDFYSGTIDYSKDKIEAPDWDPDHIAECGCGLHLAADPWTAYAFYPTEKGIMLRFLVPLSDVYPYFGSDPIFPYKVRVPKLGKYDAILELIENEWQVKK